MHIVHPGTSWKALAGSRERGYGYGISMYGAIGVVAYTLTFAELSSFVPF